MRPLTKLLVRFLANAAGLYAAGLVVKGVTIIPGLRELAILALTLTLTNLLVRPVLKLLFTPLILLTLGLFSLVVNALILWGLDYFSGAIMIDGLAPLLAATLLISAVNIVLTLLSKGFLGRRKSN